MLHQLHVNYYDMDFDIFDNLIPLVIKMNQDYWLESVFQEKEEEEIKYKMNE